MLKFFFTIITLLLLSVDSHAVNSTPVDPQQEVERLKIVTEPAKIRGDGLLVNEEGLIVGARNPDDPRTNDQMFFYWGVSEDGEILKRSEYVVYQDPNVLEPSFIMQHLFPDEKDYSEMLTKSRNSYKIWTQDGFLFFDGNIYESGALISGAIATVVDGKIYYNGEQVPDGTEVYRGKVVRLGVVEEDF